MNPPPINAARTTAIQAPGTAADESARLLAVRGLGLLDTPTEESFDRVTRLAARALQTPIAVVSLLDETREWFKSRVGLQYIKTPREASFCAHTIDNHCPLVVPDAALDSRFSSNPIVTGEPRVRAYLGIPIFTLDGQFIGTLCVVDHKPREFSEDDIATLSEFANIVQGIIHGRELAVHVDRALNSALEHENLFRATFEHAAVGIVHTSLSGKFLRINQHACTMLGYTEEELRAVPFTYVTHADDVEKNTQLFREMVAGHVDSYRMEKRYIKKDGSSLWAELSVALKRGAIGQPDYVIAAFVDISAQKRAETELARSRDTLQIEVAAQTRSLRERNEALRLNIEQLHESEHAQRRAEHRLRAIANSMPAMIGYWNRELRCEFANEAHREWFGRGPEHILGVHMSELTGEESFFALNEPHARMALAGHAQHFERNIAKIDGTRSITDARYLPDVGEDGKIRGFYVLETDITALRETQIALEAANSRLVRDNNVDYLTGLSNRRVFSERSEDAFRRFTLSRTVYGLILLDIDDFKLINDSFGHHVGDQVLGALGNLLKAELRGRTDVISRLGGEEFALLCFGDLQPDLLIQLAGRICMRISKESVDTTRGSIRFTCSFGVALSLPDDTEWTNIYARADAALYDAKAAGKNQVVYRDSSSGGATGRFRLIRCEPGA